MSSRLYKEYKKNIVPALIKEYGYKNAMEVPKLEKVVVNVGYGRHVKDKAYVDNVEETIKLITGQKPIHNKAKKSISNFKIREGMNVGASVTLRGKKMYDFVDKLVSVTLPRVRDFRGINPKSFDEQGNYTIGFKENIAFPEIDTDAVDNIHGLEVVVCTSAENKKEAKTLLEKLGFPFKKK
ncbi:MAG: 50S ribosomal protein L5 [Candidatus Magasanikbacteria bacterium]|nr:50S ribosomal protein L5 [Candidatus Magasanikbacteria bacterium]